LIVEERTKEAMSWKYRCRANT